jgi:hypothetical protein
MDARKSKTPYIMDILKKIEPELDQNRVKSVNEKNVHSKNWSVVSTLITAQKQCLGKCRFKCENDTFKCENDTAFILSSVGNDSLSVCLILWSVI